VNLLDWWDSHPHPGWRNRADCRALAPAPFAARLGTAAKRICAACPVADDCLVDALRQESLGVASRANVFGGMNATERERFAQLLMAEGIPVGKAAA
jgi:Transcription factor WhiB